jgi:hypothetical protein
VVAKQILHRAARGALQSCHSQHFSGVKTDDLFSRRHDTPLDVLNKTAIQLFF